MRVKIDNFSKNHNDTVTKYNINLSMSNNFYLFVP